MMNNDAAHPTVGQESSMPQHMSMSSSNPSDHPMKGMAATMPAGGHMMSPTDPDNPQNWPLYKKIYVSAVAFAFAWVV